MFQENESAPAARENELFSFFAERFGGAPDSVARAPGRVELIGNHLDYNGGRVAGATIDRFIRVAARARDDGRIRLASREFAGTVEADASDLHRLKGAEAWVNYPLGVLDAICRRKGIRAAGFEAAILSSIPAGAGLSSSAALELSTALALGAVLGADLTPEDLVAIGRAAENDFVGVPTGLLDQTTCAFGQENHVVFIDSRTGAPSLSPLPASARLWIFTTGVRHELADSAYSIRHAECRAALEFFQNGPQPVEWLADLSMSRLPEAEKSLPAAVSRRTRHVVEEDARVRKMEALLQAGELAAAGSLLFDSHASSRDLFENSCPELDFLVDALSRQEEVYGARLTGGGFGGAVLALTSPAFSAAQADSVATSYSAHFQAASPQAFVCKTAPAARLLSCEPAG